MVNTQSLIENVDESQFYLVEHVFENAISEFCENATIDQINLVNEYTGLINDGKMSKKVEKQLSEQLDPYIQEYVNIYSAYLFQGLEESKNEFNFADYRNKVGKDVVCELFGSIGSKIATIGAVLASAAVATWAIKDPQGLQTAIDTICEKAGKDKEKAINWVKSVFTTTSDKDQAVEEVKKAAKDSAVVIKNQIKDATSEVSTAIKPYWDKAIKLAQSAGGTLADIFKKLNKNAFKNTVM